MNFDSPQSASSPESKKPVNERLGKPELPGQIAGALKKKIDEFAEANEDFLMGYRFKDELLEQCSRIRERLGLPESDEDEDDLGIRSEQIQEPEDEFGEAGNLIGTIYFQGEPILTWSAMGDGYNGSIDSWDDAALGRAVQKYVEKLKGEAG